MKITNLTIVAITVLSGAAYADVPAPEALYKWTPAPAAERTVKAPEAQGTWRWNAPDPVVARKPSPAPLQLDYWLGEQRPGYLDPEPQDAKPVVGSWEDRPDWDINDPSAKNPLSPVAAWHQLRLQPNPEKPRTAHPVPDWENQDRPELSKPDAAVTLGFGEHPASDVLTDRIPSTG